MVKLSIHTNLAIIRLVLPVFLAFRGFPEKSGLGLGLELGLEPGLEIKTGDQDVVL